MICQCCKIKFNTIAFNTDGGLIYEQKCDCVLEFCIYCITCTKHCMETLIVLGYLYTEYKEIIKYICLNQRHYISPIRFFYDSIDEIAVI